MSIKERWLQSDKDLGSKTGNTVVCLEGLIVSGIASTSSIFHAFSYQL